MAGAVRRELAFQGHAGQIGIVAAVTLFGAAQVLTCVQVQGGLIGVDLQADATVGRAQFSGQLQAVPVEVSEGVSPSRKLWS